MKKRHILFTIAFSLILLGFILFIVSMSLNNWNINSSSTIKYETKTINVTEPFNNIYITSNTADIDFVLSTDKSCKVVYTEEKNMEYEVSISNNTLNIVLVNNKKWYNYIGIGFGKSTLKVYLPEIMYDILTINSDTSDINIPNKFFFESLDISLSTGDIECYSNVSKNIKIKTSTGDINLNDLTCENIELSSSTGEIDINDVIISNNASISVSTGAIKLENVTCYSLYSKGSTGDVSLENVIVTEKIYITRSTGDVEFEESDAEEIYIKTSTGDIEGSFLTEKVFIVKSDTGKPRVPSTTSGGKCELITSTGDINIKIK